MKATLIKLRAAGTTGFTDDKDAARTIRTDTLLPALKSGKRIVLDFADVKSSTQSFVHALLGQAVQQYREDALKQIEFRNCSPLMRTLIELVVDYSLGGFAPADSPVEAGRAQRTKREARAKAS